MEHRSYNIFTEKWQWKIDENQHLQKLKGETLAYAILEVDNSKGLKKVIFVDLYRILFFAFSFGMKGETFQAQVFYFI